MLWKPYRYPELSAEATTFMIVLIRLNWACHTDITGASENYRLEFAFYKTTIKLADGRGTNLTSV